MIPTVGVFIGVMLGCYMPIIIPAKYSTYFAVAILAAMDSIFGGIRAKMEKSFNLNMFVTGLFGNALLAAALTYFGHAIGVDMYIAAIVVFGVRLFQNFAIIRRKTFEKKRSIIKKHKNNERNL